MLTVVVVDVDVMARRKDVCHVCHKVSKRIRTDVIMTLTLRMSNEIQLRKQVWRGLGGRMTAFKAAGREGIRVDVIADEFGREGEEKDRWREDGEGKCNCSKAGV